MTIQDLGSLGELIAAIATVATLAYLAFQIRQNTASFRATAYRDATVAMNDWSTLFIHHPETVALFGKGLTDPRALEVGERAEFNHLLETLLRNYVAYSALAREVGSPLGHDEISFGVLAQYEFTFHRWLANPEFRAWALAHPTWSRTFETLVARLPAETTSPREG